MLYKANVLLYDRQTESLWSQIKSEAVAGPLTGTGLEVLPSKLTTWKKWRSLHPDTLVLSPDTGYRRDYSKDPYDNYYRSPLAFFGFRQKSPELPEKELVLGLDIEGKKKAYPFSVLRSIDAPVKDTFQGKEITVRFDAESKEASAIDKDGKELPGIVTYWFVWYSFHPETIIFKRP